MSTYSNPARALVVYDDMIHTPTMGANCRTAWTGWSVWCRFLPGSSLFTRAVTDDFGNLVAVPQ